ncbi:hypothetical protein AB0933_13535 [Streptomyces venezuelae]|uniref:hypothetical protein n=1 Tax=Streptomyces venezuelae TaxID=54571 RepID=UPI003451CDA3
MTFEDEWGKARGSAVEHQGTQMQLNQVPAEGGGGGKSHDLSFRRDEIGRIGNDAYTLHGTLQKKGDQARVNTFDASIALTNKGFLTGSALLKVHDTWNSQLKTLLAACANISNHLDFSTAAHDKDEDEIITTMRASKINEYLK